MKRSSGLKQEWNISSKADKYSFRLWCFTYHPLGSLSAASVTKWNHKGVWGWWSEGWLWHEAVNKEPSEESATIISSPEAVFYTMSEDQAAGSCSTEIYKPRPNQTFVFKARLINSRNRAKMKTERTIVISRDITCIRLECKVITQNFTVIFFSVIAERRSSSYFYQFSFFLASRSETWTWNHLWGFGAGGPPPPPPCG